MKTRVSLVAILLLAMRVPADGVDFSKQIAPLLSERCLECHNDRDSEGDLDLSNKVSAYAASDSGTAIVPGSLGESYLWERVSSDEMPPEHPLSGAEKELLREWIEQGAAWDGGRLDRFAFSSVNRAGYDWWSLQPILRLEPRLHSGERHPVDSFVSEALRQQNLAPSPQADRRTLIRRLHLDLLGFPPSAAEVDAFVSKNRQDGDAWEELVDLTLASPRYGARWARHWLDLARYGESNGFERDRLRANAWPYRDWVIQALNDDMPFDRFASLQIAGDAMEINSSGALPATGFLVAGPYDEVGQNQQSAAMRAVVRQDEMEDYVGTVCQTFLGLTVNCARCHDHKFDPITQTDYYRLASALSGVRPGNRPWKTAEAEREIQSARASLSKHQQQIADLLNPVRERIIDEQKTRLPKSNLAQPIARWTFESGFKDDLGNLHGTPHGATRIENGQLILDGKTAYVSTRQMSSSVREKTLEAWVRLDNLTQRGGGVISLQSIDGDVFDAIVFGEQNPGHWMAGSESFLRSQSFQAEPEHEADSRLVHVAIAYHSNGGIQAYRNGVAYGLPYTVERPVLFSPGQSQILLGLRHGKGPDGNRALAGVIEQAQLYDRALTGEQIAASAARFHSLTRKQLVARLSEKQKLHLSDLEHHVDRLRQRIASLIGRRVYAVTPRQPEVTRVLLRGNTGSPAEEVSAGGIPSLQGLSPEFGLSKDAPEAARRTELARWITAERNPLFARVIVNRLWHYHFGVGIVATPNDFGFNGARPTHPQLLDYLAAYLIDHDWSLKAVHRLILTSQTYQQSSKPRPKALKVDAENRFLWRYSPQRLEGELIRDSMLKVAGALNPQSGGPSYRNFETFNSNSQFYIMKDKTGPQYQRRTIYRMWVRSGRNLFLDAFDCPDPSVTTPDRATTTTPTQSLALLNNAFVLRMADELDRSIVNFGHTDASSQVRIAYRQVLQREPRREELDLATAFVKQHGLSAFARILFNTSEFLFIE